MSEPNADSVRWRIERDDDFETLCDTAHPVRLGRNAHHEHGETWERADAIDRSMKGYLCPGSETHYYTMWVVVRCQEQSDWFGRYKDAVAERDRLNAVQIDRSGASDG